MRRAPLPTLGLLVPALCLAGCLQRAAKDEDPLVGTVRIEGAKEVDEGDVKGKIAISESWRNYGFWGPAFTFEPDGLRADARRIERFYATRGYFEAKVTDTRFEEEPGRVNVTFVVTEGRRSVVEKLSLAGLEKLSADDRATVTEGLPIAEGRPFDEEDYDDTKGALRDRLRAIGYAEADVEGKVSVDRARARVQVTYTTTPGLLYRVSKVVAFGAQNVSPSRVVEQSNIAERDVLSPALLADAQARVYSLGIFSVVQVASGPFDRRNATVPVIITVTEAPFITREFGGGLEVDPTRWVLRGRALQTHRNFARGLQRITTSGSLGYAFLPSLPALLAGDLKDHGLVFNLGAEYSQPKVLRSPFDVFAAVEWDKDVTQAFRYQRLAARAGAPWRPSWLRQLSVVPSLNFERYFQVSGGTTDLTGTNFSTSACGSAVATGAVLGACNVLYGELRVNLDLRDDQISARRGAFFTVAAQYAGTPLSTFSYVRLSPELRLYWTPWKYLTLATRARYGLLEKVGADGPEPPGVSNFFGGGATSVRTSAAQQLGPRQFTVEETVQGTCTPTAEAGCVAGAPRPLGGDRLLEASVEARWRTGLSWLSLATFFDVGGIAAVGASGASAWIPDTFQYGPGLGLRVPTIFGPLRLDVAYRMTQAPETPVSVAAPNVTDPKTDPRLANDRYTLRPSCDGRSPAYTCYEDTWNSVVTGLQYFVTLGEAF